MANLMIAMILPPVGKALPERKGIAVLLRLYQEVSRMAAAARIVVRLKDVLEAVEPADLSIRQGVGPKHFVRCHGHVRITVWLDELHHRSALEELQEAELQHVSVQLVDIVERRANESMPSPGRPMMRSTCRCMLWNERMRRMCAAICSQ